MICTAEFPIAYNWYLPGTGYVWKASVPPGIDPGPAIDTYKREWTSVIKRHRNHPSIFCWVMGNEMWDGVPLRHDFHRIARQLDPKRFFADSDGVEAFDRLNPALNILLPENDRNTLDLYFLMFNVFATPIEYPNKFYTPTRLKPIVTHEEGNFVTFFRPDQIDLLKHNQKPFWLLPGWAKLEQLGLLPQANQWAEKYERLYALCHKANMEGLRKNPHISGYHWWLFQDCYTSSNGLFDVCFHPKSITREEVLKINSKVVVLQEGLGHTYRGKDRLAVKLLLSNFSSAALQGQLTWEVKAGDKVLGGEQITCASRARRRCPDRTDRSGPAPRGSAHPDDSCDNGCR